MRKLLCVDVSLSAVALLLASLAGLKAWAIEECNERKPIEPGHCGQEGPEFCDVAAAGSLHTGFATICDTSTFNYHEDAFAYDDEAGGPNDFSYERVNSPEKRCTCKYKCRWDLENDQCVLGPMVQIPNPNGNGTIGDCQTQTEWGSKECDPAGGG